MLQTLASEQAREPAEHVGIEAELDERWGCVGDQETARWLGHAIDHHTGQMLAYVMGNRVDQVFLALQALLEPFGIRRYYADKWGAYRRHLPPGQRVIGKPLMQKVKRKHLMLRTRLKRLARQTPCFSRSAAMHGAVIGLFSNQYEFARVI